MLADTSSPHGSDVNLAVVGPLSGALETDCCLPALPRRLRAMERTVRLGSPPCQTIDFNSFTDLQLATATVPTGGKGETSNASVEGNITETQNSNHYVHRNQQTI